MVVENHSITKGKFMLADVIIDPGMEMSIKDKMIVVASKYHEEHPFDAAHDLGHHRAVLANSRIIVEKENLEGEVDMDVLEVAAMVHDINDAKRGSVEENTEVIKGILKEGGADDSFIEKVLTTIGVHSFGKEQTNVEQKLLSDADKVDFVSWKRAERTIKASKSGTMSAEDFARSKEIWITRVKEVRTILHFESAKKLFDQSLNESIEFIKSDHPEHADALIGVM